MKGIVTGLALTAGTAWTAAAIYAAAAFDVRLGIWLLAILYAAIALWAAAAAAAWGVRKLRERRQARREAGETIAALLRQTAEDAVRAVTELKRPQAAPAKHGADDTGVQPFTADQLRYLDWVEDMCAGGADGGEQP
jgi:hypothetical protein